MPTGARFRPRAIREASTLYTFGHGGAYDHEDDATYLPLDRVRIVDLGDTDVVHTDMTASHANSELAVRTIIERGGFAGGTRRRPLDQYSMYPRLPRSRTDPCGADRCSPRLRRHPSSRARGARQSNAPGVRRMPCDRAHPDRHPQCVVNREGGLRGRAPAQLDHPLCPASAAAWNEWRACGGPGRRALLRHDRHRWLRILHSAGYRNPATEASYITK
jgi:hypothetical protein